MEYTINDNTKSLQNILYTLIEISNQILRGKKVEINDDYTNGYEADSSPVSWEYFVNTYIKKYIETDKLDNLYAYRCKTTNRRLHLKPPYYTNGDRICGNFKYSKKTPVTLKPAESPDLIPNESIGLAGDCCFNFKQEKINMFIKIISNEKDSVLKKRAEKLLSLAQKMHHSPLNFALMPTNGGMNIVKGDGQHGFDRFDVFVSALDLYFNINKKDKNPTAIKLIAEFETSYNSLYPFLNSIGSFKSYCDFFYPELTSKSTKDKKLLNALIKSGQKPIDSTERVIEYIELAKRFWKAKANYYKEQKKILNKNM